MNLRDAFILLGDDHAGVDTEAANDALAWLRSILSEAGIAFVDAGHAVVVKCATASVKFVYFDAGFGDVDGNSGWMAPMGETQRCLETHCAYMARRLIRNKQLDQAGVYRKVLDCLLKDAAGVRS